MWFWREEGKENSGKREGGREGGKEGRREGGKERKGEAGRRHFVRFSTLWTTVNVLPAENPWSGQWCLWCLL